jgi:hypothetical protein
MPLLVGPRVVRIAAEVVLRIGQVADQVEVVHIGLVVVRILVAGADSLAEDVLYVYLV